MDETVPRFTAAGVLPYAVVDGNVMFLLGLGQFTPWRSEDSKRRQHQFLVWSDFGGAKENTEDAEATAAREFAEETFGLFDDMSLTDDAVQKSAARMEGKLRDETQRGVSVFHACNGTYRAFLAPVPYVDDLLFNAALMQTEESEKLDFVWVLAVQLFTAIDASRQTGNRNISIRIRDRRTIHLFHKFVISLQALDLMHILQLITPPAAAQADLQRVPVHVPECLMHLDTQVGMKKRKLGLIHPRLVAIQTQQHNSFRRKAKRARRKRSRKIQPICDPIFHRSPTSVCTKRGLL